MARPKLINNCRRFAYNMKVFMQAKQWRFIKASRSYGPPVLRFSGLQSPGSGINFSPTFELQVKCKMSNVSLHTQLLPF